MSSSPKVYLVGAGPGDPELLTIKAQRLLREAEAVVYDRLVSPAVLELIPPETMRVFVGKASGEHTLAQNEINELVLGLARSRSCVVRLKGGDPLLFGRSSEEMAFLADHGIRCEIVPGVTAALGCAAELGIPLTHRGLASGVRFVTGHSREGVPLDLNWQSLADPETTLVFYMGRANLPIISANLMRAGLAGATPAVAVESGTTPSLRVCRASLAELPGAVATAGLSAPVLVIIGMVAALAEVPVGRQADGATRPRTGMEHG